MSRIDHIKFERRDIENPILSVDNLHGGYGSIQILYDISLQLGEQEICTIIGPNGSGKSTFLKVIFGLASHYRGKVEFQGEDIADWRTDTMVSKGISYVPQVDNVFADLTVKENLEMGSYLVKDDINKDLDKVYQIFPELRKRKTELAANLSGGQRQMLALSRALMTRPKLMLLDEPTAALAPNLVRDLLNKISELREEGMSILLVEQNARSALQHSDHCYIFANGRVVQNDTAEEVLSNQDLGKLFLGLREEYEG